MTNILIVTYNSIKYVTRLVSTICTCTNDFRVLVADNASDDGTREWCKDMNESDCVYADLMDSNLGFTQATNVLLRKVIYEKFDGNVVLINPDTYVRNNWIVEIEKAAAVSPSIGIVSPSLMTAGHNDTIWQKTSLTWPELTRFPGTDFVEMAWACFACVWIRRECLESVGFLDEAKWHYGSDEDFGRRARALGWRIVWAPKSSIEHVGQRSFKELVVRDEATARKKIGDMHVDHMKRRR